MYTKGRSRAKAIREAESFTKDLKPRRPRNPKPQPRSPGLRKITESVKMIFKTYNSLKFEELRDKLDLLYPTINIERRLYDVLVVLEAVGIITRIDMHKQRTIVWVKERQMEPVDLLFPELFASN